jgi:hypothetical protein
MSTEAEIQQEVRKRIAELGGAVWRNNKGAGKLENGSFVRWGLCNDSAALGARIRSADLVGIRPLLILPEHVGRTVGQFLSVECKASGWRPHDTEHEVAQRRWRDLVTGLGGYAVITCEPGSVLT